MKKQIVWVSQHLELNPRNGKLSYTDDDENMSYTDEYEGSQEGQEIQDIIATPFGLWRIDDTMNPLKQFKLWMGHTNFSIGEKARRFIANVPGVEVLYILTRYRFIIGVGELFDIRDVRTAIEEGLCGNQTNQIDSIKNPDIKAKVLELVEKENLEEKKWAMYVFPNGNIEWATTDDPEYNKKLSMMKASEKRSNGIFIESK